MWNANPFRGRQLLRHSRFTSYDVDATDADDDTVTFNLALPSTLPGNMTFNTTTGVLTWTPAPADEDNQFSFKVEATDGTATVSQSWSFTVWPENHAPVYDWNPVLEITAGQTHRDDVKATDQDKDRLTYELLEAPTGMTIDSLGRITWETDANDIGNHTVRVSVSDGRAAPVEAPSYTLQVKEDTTDPSAAIIKDPDSAVDPGDEVVILVLATDNVGVETITLTVDGTNVALDSNGRATVTFDTPGTHTIIATVTDAAGRTTTVEDTITVRDPNNATPKVEITSPNDRAVITAPTDIIGNITDNENDLVRYTLSYAPLNGPGGFKVISEVVAPTGQTLADVTGIVLGKFDPTILANGPYVIRLEAEDENQGVSTIEQTVNVTGRLKLGNFTVSFTDITIPVAGIPITIGRTYDTLQANESGDFGYGWSLDIKSAQLEVDEQTLGGQGWGNYRAYETGTRLTVTLPDGRTEGFTFDPVPNSYVFSNILSYRPYFKPDPGNTTTLESKEFSIDNRQTGEWQAQINGNLVTYNPADPAFGNELTLTTYPDRLKYILNVRTGEVKAMEDRNENRITYTYDGAVSNRGRDLDFERDFRGRITRITDPRGNYLLYEYDAAGNLVAFYDRMNSVEKTNPITYSYLGASAGEEYEHFLETITDPYGRESVKNTYDADGRLKELTDADGQVVKLDYDLNTLTQKVTDQLGNSGAMQFDATGNVIREQNQLGETVVRTYQPGTSFLTSETQVVGVLDDATNGESNDLTTSFVVNGFGQPTEQTDATGLKTKTTYNKQGLPISTTDALGNTTYTNYDDKGNLLSTTDPNGNTTSFEYDTHGNVLKITSGGDGGAFGGYGPGCDPFTDPECGGGSSGVVTTLGYNDFGDLDKTTSANGNQRTAQYDANGNLSGTSATWVDPGDALNQSTTALINTADKNDRVIGVGFREGHPSFQWADA